jgi:hypothetical protein
MKSMQIMNGLVSRHADQKKFGEIRYVRRLADISPLQFACMHSKIKIMEYGGCFRSCQIRKGRLHMDEQLKSTMRDILLECYGVDIQNANCHFSTQNYAFIFPGEPFMIRVSITPKKTRAEILSELMWLDDLKQFKQTICEPNVSLRGNLMEEFEIDGQT